MSFCDIVVSFTTIAFAVQQRIGSCQRQLDAYSLFRRNVNTRASVIADVNAMVKHHTISPALPLVSNKQKQKIKLSYSFLLLIG